MERLHNTGEGHLWSKRHNIRRKGKDVVEKVDMDNSTLCSENVDRSLQLGENHLHTFHKLIFCSS